MTENSIQLKDLVMLHIGHLSRPRKGFYKYIFMYSKEYNRHRTLRDKIDYPSNTLRRWPQSSDLSK